MPFNPSKSLSIYIRIFINYAQMIAIIQSLELKWPFYVTTYLQISGNVGSVSTQLFSLDCLINDFELNIKVIYLKALANVLIYLGFLFTSAWIFMFRKCLLKKHGEINRFIILVIVLSIILQPNSIKDTSDIFNCQEIEDKYYLIAEMTEECYTADHKKWVLIFWMILYFKYFLFKMYSFGVPILFFWILFYPLICLFYLIYHKREIERIDIKIKMGYYLNGYKTNYFYW